MTSSWIGRSATKARGQASSLYLFSYYMGSSIMGTCGGYFWQSSQWVGVIAYISGLLIVGLIVALYLKKRALAQ